MSASRRVSPSERFRARVDELFNSGRELGQILEEVARLGVALLFQVALEAEVTEFLGRERYARSERDHEGLRNGYAPITVKTTSGPITLERPKLRGNREPFASRLLGIGVTRTKALESLVIAGFVRGLSTRDVEATLEEALGEQAALSKSTVSRICGVLVSQFELWQRRDLSGYELDYLFADASFFKYHPAARGEPILCTWGITTEGRKVFIHLSAGAAESFDSWQAHFSDLRERGLRPPLLGITDGKPGLVGAFELVYSESLRQRCASAGADSRPRSPASDGCRISAASCSARLSSRRPAERLPALAAIRGGVSHPENGREGLAGEPQCRQAPSRTRARPPGRDHGARASGVRA